jgi:hypothetical protein
MIGNALTATDSSILGLPTFKSLTNLQSPVPRSSIRFTSAGMYSNKTVSRSARCRKLTAIFKYAKADTELKGKKKHTMIGIIILRNNNIRT